MRFFILIVLFFSFNYAQNENEIYVRLNHFNHDEWWSKYNNRGIESKRNNISVFYQKKISDIQFDLNVHLLDKKLFLGQTTAQVLINKNNLIKVGRYYRDFSSYLNDDLSSGSMLISQNAKPMPKIGFLSSKNLSAKKGINFDYGISHAVFEKNNYYDSAPYLHEKFIYLNIRKSTYEFSIGFVHEAMWGGSIIGLGEQPRKFKDFIKVFLSSDGKLKDGEPHANALGNHLGIWDFYFKKEINNYSLKIYYQHFFEDTSGLRFANKWDGLWGIEFINLIPKTSFLVEYLDTSNQYINPPYVADAYYNHTEYKGGWSYKSYSLGNPFINHEEVNPLKLAHIGMKGKISKKFVYEVLASRKINDNDFIKYKVAIKKVSNHKQSISISMINSENDIGVEFGIIRFF